MPAVRMGSNQLPRRHLHRGRCGGPHRKLCARCTPIRLTRSGRSSAPAPKSKSGTRTWPWPKRSNVLARRSIQWLTTRHYRCSGSTAASASSRCKLGRRCTRKAPAMHHCVASYWENVVDGKSRIYSILENGSRVATLELTSRLTQHKGPNDGRGRATQPLSGEPVGRGTQLAPGT